MHFLMFNPLYLSLLDDGISNRMINVFLKTGTDSENIFLTVVPKRQHLFNYRIASCDCPSLIK